MDERVEKLRNLRTAALVDVVKNYKNYNYPEEIKLTALDILKERGVKPEALKLSGNFTNKPYDSAISQYKKYNKNSILGLIFFVLSIILFKTNSLFSIIFYIIALIFIGYSFSNMKKISKILKDDRLDYSPLLIFVSLFLYFIVYFVNRKTIREAINLKT